MNNRKLVLENGMVFNGLGFGSNNEAVCELVFNTAVVGYQENLTDPSNYGKMMCLTYPVIGSYGLTSEDNESKTLTVSGLVVREYNDEPSNFRFTTKLDEVMDEAGVPGIMNVDTRYIARILRDNGVMKALICDIDKPLEECLEVIKNYSTPKNIVEQISSKKVWHSRTTNPHYTVVAIDCGLKKSNVNMLNKAGCNVVVVPYGTTSEQIMKYKPNGLLISSGPGNPEELTYLISQVSELKGKLPILGLGLGQNVIALSYGASVYRLNVGHNGCNLPVKNLTTGKIEITTQNNIYAINEESLQNTTLTVTHKNVLDGAVAGISDIENNVIAISYHPNDTAEVEEYVFNRFTVLMRKAGNR